MEKIIQAAKIQGGSTFVCPDELLEDIIRREWKGPVPFDEAMTKLKDIGKVCEKNAQEIKKLDQQLKDIQEKIRLLEQDRIRLATQITTSKKATSCVLEDNFELFQAHRDAKFAVRKTLREMDIRGTDRKKIRIIII